MSDWKVYYTVEHQGRSLSLWLLDLDDKGEGVWTLDSNKAMELSERQAQLMVDLLTEQQPTITFQTTYFV